MGELWPSSCLSPGSDVATLSCIPTIFLNSLSALLAFAGLVALIMFILGGFKLMNSAGDAKKIDSAKNNFTFGMTDSFSETTLSAFVINV